MNYLNVAGQCTWIPSPPLTQENLPSQSGKVVIITGANTGIGQKLAEILYCASATVYIAGRNPEKCLAAIEGIKTGNPSITEGKLEFLKLDLGDLSTVKGSAEEFLRREKRLDVLVNNAGVMFPPKGSKTVQGYDLQLGTNCLGPYLFTQLLLPLLQKTAEGAAKDSVRVAWAGSLAVDLLSPVGGAEFDDQGQVVQYEDPQKGYGLSKCGNRFLAKGLAEDDKTGRIVSVVCFAFSSSLSLSLFSLFLLSFTVPFLLSFSLIPLSLINDTLPVLQPRQPPHRALPPHQRPRPPETHPRAPSSLPSHLRRLHRTLLWFLARADDRR